MSRRFSGGSIRRKLALFAITLPLLQTINCVDLTQTALITGFFDGITPALLESAQAAFQNSLAGSSASPSP